MESMVEALKGKHDFVAPEPASEADLERVHGRAHIQRIRQGAPLYDIACLAAGGAIYGDGTANVFAGSGEAVYFHPEAATRPAFLEEVERALRCPAPHDLVAVSAGFDRHEQDWGDLLATEDYFAIGRQVREHAHRRCRGRRFGVLEGGYNHAVLGQNVRRFLEGLGD
jgi:acetoin utilization deacetylase AcuC-like enzyme